MNPLKYLREKGWTKFEMVDGHNGHVCMSGAMSNSYNVLQPDDIGRWGYRVMWKTLNQRECGEDEVKQAMEIIQAEYPERSPDGFIPRFNDHEDTTQEDVERILGKIYGEELS